MTKSEIVSSAFLEAHYYSGGLRQHCVSTTGERPTWAPRPEAVGFRNEFLLFENDAVIEFQRRTHQGSRITWIALYGPSTDETLGERANYSGVGVWLRDLSIVDTRSVIHALKQLKNVLGTPFNPIKLDSQASKFLTDWLPKYVRPFQEYLPGFPGVQYSTGQLLATKLYSVSQTSQPDPYDCVADHLLKLSFHPISSSELPRSLICISDGRNKRPAEPRMEIISPDTDIVSEFISIIPDTISESSKMLSVLAQNNQKLEQINRESAETIRHLSATIDGTVRDRDELRDRLDTIERGRPPMPHSADIEKILISINRIDRRMEQAREQEEYTNTDLAPLFYILVGSVGILLFGLMFWSIAHFGRPIVTAIGDFFKI